uniref:Probable palmitoyltransferase zdhhc6 n=1 Tax=Ictalurus furcatus TaxID=66913 RepID=E3TBQ0_ICTFU|nr:probable palmitoyltransferase zdhhc6 [Ictalurus furcatus]
MRLGGSVTGVRSLHLQSSLCARPWPYWTLLSGTGPWTLRVAALTLLCSSTGLSSFFTTISMPCLWVLGIFLYSGNRKIHKTLGTYSSVECVKAIKPQDLTTAESVTGV